MKTDPPLRIVFLGYLWKVAQAVHDSPAAEIVSVGLESRRRRTTSARRWCLENDLPIFDASTSCLETIVQDIDLLVVGAFGRILPSAVWNAPRLGTLNVHCAELPRYRGGWPIEWQILCGEARGGVTLHWMTEAVDAGPVAAQESFEIGPQDDYDTVFDSCHHAAAEAMAKLLRQPPSHWPRREQGKGEPPVPARRKRDGLIDWRRSARSLERQIRAEGWREWVRCEDGKRAIVVRKARAISDEACLGPPGTVLEIKRNASDRDLAPEGKSAAGGLSSIDIATGAGVLRWLECSGDLEPTLGMRLPCASRRRIQAGEGPKTKRRKTVALMQPTLLPWLGYFALMAEADLFVFLDDFQFCRRSFHQRNRLLNSKHEAQWITLPVSHQGRQDLDLRQVQPTETARFGKTLLGTMRHAYRDARFVGEFRSEIESWLKTPWPDLASMNIAFIEKTAGWLGLKTTCVRSSSFASSDRRSWRLRDLLRATDAEIYLAARGSFRYMLDDGVFPLDGVETRFQNFECVPYPQYGSGSRRDFVASLSILDALFHVGPEQTCRLLDLGCRGWTSWQEMHEEHEPVGS